MSNNGETKFADWVAYRVTRDTIGSSRDRKWKRDPDLPADETLSPNDYKGANSALGTDRGHQVPLASFAGTQHWQATNYLSNITPQNSRLNRGAWAQLESEERELIKEGNEAVFVLTGPVYQRKMKSLPSCEKDHQVPSGYWKIVATLEEGQLRTAAFFFDQDVDKGSRFCDAAHQRTVDQVETVAGLDFFPGLDDGSERRVEEDQGALRPALDCP